MSTLLAPGRDGFFHPANENEIQDLVRMAGAHGLQVRVRGSAHSSPEVIFSDGVHAADDRGIDLMLDRCTGIHFDDDTRQVRIEAGVRFGRDPRDPTGRSTDHNGLCAQLEARGWALPNLSGITHQTVVGYFATGSSGGSCRHELGLQVVSFRLIDGVGEVHELTQGSDAFAAALVAFGTCGVVTALTLACVERFDIIGTETISGWDDGPCDLFADGAPGLAAFLRETEYARLLLWPQKGVEKLVTWQARRMTPGDYNDETGARGALRPRAYHPFPLVFGSTLPTQAAAGTMLQAIDRVQHLAAKHPLAERAFEVLQPTLYGAFVDTAEPQRFWQPWWQGLPMDNMMSDALLPVTFTELWLPLERAAEAMRRLRDFFATHRTRAAGNFAIEIYGGATSPFWLSPGHRGEALRVNVFWFTRNRRVEEHAYFDQFWRVLMDLGCVGHWGKYLPGDTESLAAIRERYSRWQEFLARRERFDPAQLFINDYWRKVLALQKIIAPHTPVDRHEKQARSYRKRPLLFRLAPTDASLAARAEHTFDNSADIDATPEEVYDLIERVEQVKHWVPHIKGMEWLTHDRATGAVLDETFWFMTLRLRMVHAERGRRWANSVDASTLPLASEMFQDIKLEALPGGRTRLRWQVHYNVLPLMRRLHPLLQPFFAALFRNAAKNLTRYFRR